MEERAFYKTINSFMEELNENLFGVGILYDMCNDKLHPWGNKYRLGDKLCFISRLNGFCLREEFLRYDMREVDGKTNSRHRRIDLFGSLADMLLASPKYKAFAEKISGVRWQFAYDAGDEDIEHFKESLNLVFEFNDILKKAIVDYDELYDVRRTRGDNIPFASTFLHFHRPEQFFAYDFKIFKGMLGFHSPNGCRIGGAIIDEEAKARIAETRRKVLKPLCDDGIYREDAARSVRADYIRAMVLEYAICCYVKEHSDEIDGLNNHPFPLISSEIVARIRKVKTQDEIYGIIDRLKPETPVTELALYCEDAAELDQIVAEYLRRK